MNSISLDDVLPPLPDEVLLVPFHPGHVSAMQIDDVHIRETARHIKLAELLEMQAASGHAITALLNGRPVACFGATKLWNGVEEMWSLIENRARKYPKTLTKIAMAYCDFRAISGNLHRLQINVRCADRRAFRWAIAIGFELEGTMRKYGPDQSDFFIMART